MRGLLFVFLNAAVILARPATSVSSSKRPSEAESLIKSTPLEIIIKKRDGLELTDAEVRDFVSGFTAGDIPDYQCASFLMAVNCRGMTDKVRSCCPEVFTTQTPLSQSAQRRLILGL
jgi:hypothetical protein